MLFRSGISKLKNLEVLDLERNEIASFPWTITEMPNLRVLKLGRNKIPMAELDSLRKAIPHVKVDY